MKTGTAQIANNGLDILIKLYDFLVINFIIASIIFFIEADVTISGVFIGFLYSTLFLLIGEYFSIYRLKFNQHKRDIFKQLALVSVISIGLIELLKYFFSDFPGYEHQFLSLSYFLLWYLLSFVAIIGFRFLIFHIFKRLNKHRRIAILGLTASGLMLEKALLKEYFNVDMTFEFYDDRDEKRFGYLVKNEVKGSVNDLLEKAKKGEIYAVYITLPLVARRRIKSVLQQLTDTTVDTYLVPDFYTYSMNVSQLKMVDNIQTYSVFSSPFYGVGAFAKRMIDIVVGSAILLGILPILAAVAIGVKVTSPGPVLFKQDRYGLGGKRIKVWKFRSMKVMENSYVVTQATKGDPRVTKFGAFLRRTSLDELPQFFNVLQGDMSIVGPRPHAVSHNEQYRKIVDNYMIRHKMKPGITGLAQISGFRGETDTLDKMVKRVEYDIRYMKNWTPFTDIKIIFLTVFKGFVSDTAY